MVEIKDKRTYFDLIRDFEYIPFTQSEGWHDFHTCLKPNSTRFFVDDAQHPTIALFGHVKKFLGLKMLVIEGECFKTLSSDYSRYISFYSKLQFLEFQIIEINSSYKYNTSYEESMRNAGFNRPVGLFSTPLSIWINTSKPVNFDRNWKRNIGKATVANLQFQQVELKQEFVMHFTQSYREMSSFKGFKHTLNELQIQSLLDDSNFQLYIVTTNDSQILASRIVYIHQQFCTDVLAANTIESRAYGATHFLLSSLFLNLKEKSIATFDFSRISYSHEALKKIATFKKGAKGEIIQYNGEWSWYKFPILRPAMYFVKKFLFKRVEV